MAKLNPKYEQADTDGQYYRKEEVEWVIQPSDEDPGWIGPKVGATPVSYEEAHDLPMS